MLTLCDHVKNDGSFFFLEFEITILGGGIEHLIN